MIDHGRAFRTLDELQDKKVLKMCERMLFAKMKELTEPQLKKELGEYLTGAEIKGLLKRRDKIVDHFEKAGPGALYTYKARYLQ
jgi:hypothetical protein